MKVTIVGAGNMGRGIGTRVVAGGHDPEVDLQAAQLVDELVDQIWLDGVFDDRVALLPDRGDVVGDVGRGHGPRHVRQGTS